MKVLAPISTYNELEMLAASGAEEFYCGIVPREWLDRYTRAVWLNRRSPKGGSLESLSELKQLVEGSHGFGIPVFLTLNAPYYTAEQLSWVTELARRLDGDVGID